MVSPPGICGQVPVPFPAPEFFLWPADKPVHRVHSNRFGAANFNGTANGNARFSPIRHDGKIIPTIYGGSTLTCAMMETIFHDLPHGTFPRTVHLKSVAGLQYSTIVPTSPLKLVDLSVISLHRYHIDRGNLIDTEKSQYSMTRLWAEAFYAQYKDCQGLRWISRRDDGAEAIVLFGDRILAGTLQQLVDTSSIDIMNDVNIRNKMARLALRLDVLLV
jgi:hypothetical protein